MMKHTVPLQPQAVNYLSLINTAAFIKYNYYVYVLQAMSKHLTFILAAIFTCISGYPQKPFELGGEYLRAIGKGYNSAKVAARGESFNNKSSLSIGITYQLSSKKAYSVSSGFGLYLGYRYSFTNKPSSIFAGARVLFSFENFEGQTNRNSLFVTPWAEAGYHFVFAKHIYAAPSIGYGYTLKVSKDFNSLNEDDGGRLIPSLSAGYRF